MVLPVAVNDLLGDAFQAGQHLCHVLGNEGQAAQNGQEHVQDTIGDASVFYSQRVQRAEGVRQLQRHFLDQVYHFGIVFDHFADLIQRAGEFGGERGIRYGRIGFEGHG